MTTSRASGRYAPFSPACPLRSLEKSSLVPEVLRTAVYRQGLQGVHPHFGHDARQDFTVLPSIERQNRTLAQIAERGVHPPRNAAVARRCAASGGGLRRALQYNNVRLNSAIGYIAPKDMLAGHQQEIQAERDRKLEAAREQRKNRRQQAA